VAECLRKGTPTFYTYVYSPASAMLVSKGLAWTPSTRHNQDNYPFSFNDFVWNELCRRKDELIERDNNFKREAKVAQAAGLRRR
jgi:hypothetical protein